jgi:hypothetical protein
MEYVADLEAGAVHQNQVASDEVMSISGRRRRKHDFQLMRTGPHSFPKLHRKISMNDELPLQTRWQAIALSQARRQMRIVSTVPVVDVVVPVVISVTVVPGMFVVSTAVVFMGTTVILVASSVIFVGTTVIVLIPVLVVSVSMVLRRSDCGRERQRQNCGCAGPDPKLQ